LSLIVILVLQYEKRHLAKAWQKWNRTKGRFAFCPAVPGALTQNLFRAQSLKNEVAAGKGFR